MEHVVTVEEQLREASGDPLRVLVVGAGVAGVTLAGLLRRRGLHPVVLERSGPGAGQGYMLALMPLVDAVVERLGVREAYLRNSTALTTYALRDRHGRPVRERAVSDLLSRYGDYRGISRAALLEVLTADGLPVSRRTTVSRIRQDRDLAVATVSTPDGDLEAAFDVVVAADGLHSPTRHLLLGEVPGTDTGWGGWIAWTGPGLPADRGEEVWGSGFFVAAYPVRGDTGVIVGGPAHATRRGPAAFVTDVRARLRRDDGVVAAALDAVAADDDPYYWALRDRRSPRWSVGRVQLLGDAAAGFLPTAGIGAAMAMESAGALAELLERTSAPDVPDALAEFERVQRPRVETAQSNSRALARLMFLEGGFSAALRDRLARHVTLGTALRPIIRLLDGGPHPGSPVVEHRTGVDSGSVG